MNHHPSAGFSVPYERRSVSVLNTLKRGLIVRRVIASNLTEYVGRFDLQGPGKVNLIAKIVAR
jgi:hypothetical protein